MVVIIYNPCGQSAVFTTETVHKKTLVAVCQSILINMLGFIRLLILTELYIKTIPFPHDIHCFREELHSKPHQRPAPF